MRPARELVNMSVSPKGEAHVQTDQPKGGKVLNMSVSPKGEAHVQTDQPKGGKV